MSLLCLCPVGCLNLAFLNSDSQKGRDSNFRTQQKKISIGRILFLYYEKSLVSSNLNSKLFRFHCVRPNVDPTKYSISTIFLFKFKLLLSFGKVQTASDQLCTLFDGSIALSLMLSVLSQFSQISFMYLQLITKTLQSDLIPEAWWNYKIIFLLR